MTARLSNKVSIITGAAQGIGLATAIKFAQEGAIVIVCDVKQEAVDEAVAQCRAVGATAEGFVMDVTQRPVVDAVVAQVKVKFGRIDVLVNNAGIAPVPPNLLGVTEDLFDKTVAVNLKGPLRLTALAAEHMAPGSTVINISSKASTHPSPFTVVYAAAKAGLNALTKAAAQEYAPRGIRVNAIVCGMFHTDSFHASVPTPELQAGAASRVGLGRIGDADEIVGTALYLATDASSYLTGQCITLDGGGA